MMWDQGIEKVATDAQGFILSDGSFATRERAWSIAVAACQCNPNTIVRGALLSEDVW
jgi:hypothetical protein